MQTKPHHEQVNIAYIKIVDVLLALKAAGISTDAMSDAIVRAAYQAGLERIK